MPAGVKVEVSNLAHDRDATEIDDAVSGAVAGCIGGRQIQAAREHEIAETNARTIEIRQAGPVAVDDAGDEGVGLDAADADDVILAGNAAQTPNINVAAAADEIRPRIKTEGNVIDPGRALV